MSEKDAAIPGFIRQAILDTFQVQVNMKVDIDSVAVVQNGETGVPADCLSVLGIKSSLHTGSLAIWFPKETYLTVLEKMIGEKHTEITQDNADACSEFLNIIYASARTNINQSGFDFQPAIPTTVRGNNLAVATGANAQVLRFTCKSEAGSFGVGFSLKKAG